MYCVYFNTPLQALLAALGINCDMHHLHMGVKHIRRQIFCANIRWVELTINLVNGVVSGVNVVPYIMHTPLNVYCLLGII